VALHFCVQSLIVSIGGTLAVIGLQGDSAWPLATFSSIMAVAVLVAQGWLNHQGRLRT
jgi:DHA1 family florfenicol/chloramphenicol resistance protein-like MFS transporter